MLLSTVPALRRGLSLLPQNAAKAGKVVVSVDAYTAMQKVPKTIPVLNGPEFAKLANENLVNAGQAPNPPGQTLLPCQPQTGRMRFSAQPQ
jgi:hypothetical protein